MKIASLFAELGFKVEGSDLDTLRSFETTLNGIADAADRAIAALKQLKGVKIRVAAPTTQPANPSTSVPATPSSNPSAPLSSEPPLLPRSLPGMPSFIGPTRPIAPPPPPPSFGSKIFSGLLGGLQNAFPLLKLASIFTLGATAMSALVRGISEVIKGLVQMTKATLDASVATEKVKATTGLSRAEQQGFEQFAATAGISSDIMIDAAKNFQLEAQKIRFGEGDVAGYAALGINPFQSTTKLLQQFADKTRNMNEQEARFWATRLGIGDELFSAIRNYSGALDKAADKTLQISSRAQQANREASRSLSLLSVAGNRFWEALTSKLSPAISFVTDALTGLVNMVTRLLNGIGLVVDVFSAIGEAKSMVLNWGKNNVLDWLGKQFTDSGSSSTPSGTAQATVPTPSMATQAISPSAPPLPSSVQNKSVSTTVNMKNDFNIDGSENPRATGAAINRELQRSWSDTYNQSPAYQGISY